MNTRIINHLFFCYSLLLFFNTPAVDISPELLLSPEDQQMLDEIDKEVNAFVNTLSPEQQEQFRRDVDELTKVMSQMKPEELNSFVEGVFKGEITELPTLEKDQVIAPQPTPTPIVNTPTQPSNIPAVTKQPEPIQLPLLKKTIESIETVIDQIETFLRKTQIIPKIEGKVVRWAQQGRIIGWQSGATWNRFKAQIDDLVQKLYKAKDRDPKTKDYHYITAIIANKALTENIDKLGNNLKKWVPHIEAPAFGQVKLTQAAQNAIEQVSSILLEALFNINISQELDAIFAGYTSLAAQKRVEEQKSGGTSKVDRLPLAPRPASGSTSSSSREKYNAPYPFELPSYELAAAKPYKGPSSSPQSKNLSKPEKTVQKSSSSPSPSTKKIETSKKDNSASTPEKKSPAPQDSVAEGYLDEIISNIEKTFDFTQKLKNIKNHLIDKNQEAQPDLALIQIPQAIKFAQKATDKVNALKRRVGRLTDNEQKKSYRTALNSSSTKSKINNLQQLSATLKDLKDIENSIHPDKQYAYFGGMNSAQASATVKQQIPNPSSITQLEQAITKLVGAIKDLGKAK